MARTKYTVTFPAAKAGDRVTVDQDVYLESDSRNVTRRLDLNESLTAVFYSDAASVTVSWKPRGSGVPVTQTVTTGTPTKTTGGLPNDWQPNTPYLAGTMVVNNTALYRAKTDFTSGATFSASNWEAIGSAAYVAQGGLLLSPRDSAFGAKGDGVTLTDAAITSGSATLTSASAAFTAADVGKLVVVLPAPGSSQATFATSISAVGSGTSVTLAANAPYTGTGLEATYATDDTVALKAWLAAPSTATRFLPSGIFGFTDTLTLGGTYGVWCADGATLKVMAQIANPTTWPGGARIVPTAIATSFTTLNTPGIGWQGGTVDCSILCDDGFAPKWVRTYRVRGLTVRLAKVRSVTLGDASTTGTSYQAHLSACTVWRDMGIVPVGGTALNAGGTPGSIGIYFDANCSDSTVDGKTVVMGSQVGVEIHSSDILNIGTHVWCRSTIGWVDYCFDDYVGTNVYTNTYADTPKWAGYRNRGSKGRYISAAAYNNNLSGSDNQAAGFILDAPTGNHTLIAPYIQGQDGTHRFAFDFSQISGGNLTQLTVLPPSVIQGLQNTNVVGTRWDTATPRRVDPETASFTLFSSDAGSIIEMNSASATTITLPSTAPGFPIGAECDVMQLGTGKVSVASDGTSVILSPGGLLGTRVQYSQIHIRRRSATSWHVTGDLG